MSWFQPSPLPAPHYDGGTVGTKNFLKFVCVCGGGGVNLYRES